MFITIKKSQLSHKKEKLTENYWFQLGAKLYETYGKISYLFQIRAQYLIKIFNFSSHPYSAIKIDNKTKKS